MLFDPLVAAKSLYRPLPTQRSIRLLKIVDTSPRDCIKLTCCIKIADLDEVEDQYETLSYTWDSPIDEPSFLASYGSQHRVPVLLYDEQGQAHIVKIQRNLFEAILHIFTTNLSAGATDLPFWADALCINQADDAERPLQLGLMGQIYLKARGVRVWLGPDDGTAAQLVWIEQNLVPRLRQWVRSHGAPPPMNQHALTADGILAVESLQIGVPRAHQLAIAQFVATRRLLSRAWIVQEVILSKKILALMGSTYLDLIGLFKVYEWISTFRVFTANVTASGFDTDLVTARRQGISSWHKARDLLNRGIQTQRLTCRLSDMYDVQKDDREGYAMLMWLLTLVQPFEATEPRDKIACVLGMLEASCNPAFKVSGYMEGAEKLYIHTTKLLLQGLPRLYVFSMIGDRSKRRLTTLPSWVPDFSSIERQPGLRWSQYVASEGTSYGFNFLRYDAWPLEESGKQSYLCKLHFFDDKLLVHGRYIGTIKDVLPASDISAFRSYSRLPPERCFELIAWAMKVSCAFGSRYDKTQQSLVTAFFEAFCAAEWFTFDGCDYDHVESLRDYLLWIRYGVSITNNDLSFDELMRGARAKFNTDLREELTVARISDTSASAVRDFEAHLDTYRADWQRWEQAASLSDSSNVGLLPEPLWKSLAAGNQNTQFYTDNRFLGQGLPSTRIKDEVWLLQESRVAFVLRPTKLPGHYEMIGEAHVNGVMQGQMLRGDQTENLRRIVIV